MATWRLGLAAAGRAAHGGLACADGLPAVGHGAGGALGRGGGAVVGGVGMSGVGRGNKFGARRVACSLDGTAHWHDSQGEARRHQVLHLAERAGRISAVEVHPRYVFRIGGIQVGTYAPDFRYQRDGQTVIEDYKGGARSPSRTEAYGLRKRLMLACYGITVEES